MSDESSKKPRTRSPAYPGMNLAEAIDKVKIVYDREGHGRHPVPVTAIAKDWEYSSVNGSVLSAVSALKQFGLLMDVEAEGDSRKLIVTPEAINIVARAEQSPDRLTAIKTAALSPTLYASLWKKFHWPLPSDDTIREHLEIERGYNPKFIGQIIADFKSTISFAKLTPSDKIDDGEGPAEGGDVMGDNTNPDPKSAPAFAKERPGERAREEWGGPRVVLDLPRGNQIEIRLRSKVTAAEFEKIKRVYDLSELSFVANDDENGQQ
jgi:hypothetical protein